MKRRTFIQQTSALAGLSALAANQTQAQNSAPAEFPIIISTWNNVKANEAAWAMVQKTGRALDAVEAGALIPEADPNEITVGYGGLPDRDGHVTLDACIMDEKGNAGSVTFLEGIMHPISVARAVMEKTPHVMLSGEGALQFALSQGFKKQNLLTESSKKAWLKWKKESKYEPKVNIERHDTIGLLALGKKGEVSGACTTSGMAYKMHGRVGDSPIIGAGTYADAGCAVSGTGWGEYYIRTAAAHDICARMQYLKQGPVEAGRAVINERIPALGGDGGAIVLAADGRVAAPFNTQGMYRGWIGADGVPHVAIFADETLPLPGQ